MKKAKIFKNGQSQAVRLPKEFQFDGQEVYAQKTEGGILLTPVEDRWSTFKKSLTKFSNDFMQDREQPQFQEREGLD